MIKTLSKAQKMEREKFRIPRSVQDAIPIRRIFADGIFQVGNQYSKTWSFTDINYAIAGKEDKTSMFLDYSELLNALDSGASAKITIYNRRINKAEFERSVLLPDRDDGLDEYRHEFNRMLTAQVTGTSNSIVRERYLTVSVVKRNADEARSYFARVGTDLVTHLAQLFSVAQELTLTERLHIFRDFFKAGEQAAAEFNIHEHSKRGQHFKDWFCPDSMEFAADHFKLDARYGRVLYLQDYASYIKDSFVSELCDLDRDLMLSIDILPVPTDEAARQLQSTLLGVETNVANWQRRQNANNNFTATVPYDMELQRKETKEIRNGYKGTPPTLQDFYRLLQMQPEPEAQGLALASELFITGTLNTFAQRTNVDTNARIIDYDIRELGEQLMPLGMLVTLDAIYNRVIRNWKSGKTTWIFCDEFYVLFRYEYSANFFYKLWKRIRKYNGLITGLTQNVEELLRSDTARLMLANSEFLVLLNQSATDREELAKLLNISDTQLGYITNVPAGCGLIRCAGSIVPFTNSFPKNTRLYQLMTTKPDEALR